MKKVALVARLVLGLVFTVFSINFFFPFLPPPEMTEPASNLFGALLATGYLVPIIKVIELIAGILLLAGILVPFALTILAPIVVNIVLFHIFLDPAGMPIAVLVLILEVYLAWAYRDAYKGVLDPRAKPTV